MVEYDDVGSIAWAASPTSVTREGSQGGAGLRNPNGITKIESRPTPATRARAAGCQPSTAASIAPRSMAGVPSVHSADGGITVPCATLQLIMT